VLPLIVILAVLCLALTSLASGAGAAKPTFGKPPIPGKYVFHPGIGPRSLGFGSLTLKRHNPHGYTVVNMRITLPETETEACDTYGGQVARVTHALHIRRFVAHRVGENEIGWGIPVKKHSRGSGFVNAPNVQVSVESQILPAHLDLGFSRGVSRDLKPVSGDISLPQVDPECLLSFSGHRVG
jgi:hypothetical protein